MLDLPFLDPPRVETLPFFVAVADAASVPFAMLLCVLKLSLWVAVQGAQSRQL